MEEKRFTPGPWHVMRGDVLDKNGRMVASIEGFCRGECDEFEVDSEEIERKINLMG